MVQPSCPVLVVHHDDAFRKQLIAELDRNHFSVTAVEDGEQAVGQLSSRAFSVILVGLNLASGVGKQSLEFLRSDRERIKCGILIVGDPDPAVRTFATWADETFLKPVDAGYLVTRARAYCMCA
jgi:DNA-binding response OmpR family regulator